MNDPIYIPAFIVLATLAAVLLNLPDSKSKSPMPPRPPAPRPTEPPTPRPTENHFPYWPAPFQTRLMPDEILDLACLVEKYGSTHIAATAARLDRKQRSTDEPSNAGGVTDE